TLIALALRPLANIPTFRTKYNNCCYIADAHVDLHLALSVGISVKYTALLRD
ncbi:MAG: hypothetical protein QOJ42_4801, partial [Acidobacteriaceae bacterium]|nr:hypothetical protein [Acidobacteriaceae bacterium]